MARKDRARGQIERLGELLRSGDHRRARAEARAILADAEAPEPVRHEAAAVLASLAPDRGVVAAGVLGAAAAVALAIWTLVKG